MIAFKGGMIVNYLYLVSFKRQITLEPETKRFDLSKGYRTANLGEKMTVFVHVFFPRPLFRLFSSFQTNFAILQ